MILQMRWGTLVPVGWRSGRLMGRPLLIGWLGWLVSFAPMAAQAQSPRFQVIRPVEKGLTLGLHLGGAVDFNPPAGDPVPGVLVGLEGGWDVTDVFRLKAGFMTIHYSSTDQNLRGSTISMDFDHNAVWGGAQFALLATERFFASVQAGAGYLAASPKTVQGIEVAGKSDVVLIVGGALEWYTALRHFSAGVEANALIMPIRGDVAAAAFFTVRYTFSFNEAKEIRPPADRDGDGVPDAQDKCPDVWGPESNRGCPETDTDSDGVVDREDACPQEPGPASNQGCPVDKDSDGDGLKDREDRCPKEPGPASNQGCPEADSDGDGIPDRIDKCPEQKGKPEYDGCPSKNQVKVVVRQESFELREKIHFETNKAVIKKESFPLLDQVVAALRQHPEITKLQIEGHTDSVGSAPYNLNLSQRRAEAVVAYLVGKGIEPDRLVAKGFGLTRPIASNATEKGRSMNRRVEMIILERSE